MSAIPVLAVDGLAVEFKTRAGTVKALDGVSLSVGRGEMLGVVGESGSGKSVSAYAMLGILDEAGRVTRGTAMFGGTDLLKADESTMQDLRGRELSMIFQNPRAALNPIRRVGKQIADVLIRHGSVPKAEAPGRAIEMLAKVKIPDPARRAQAYPFELSGGMCQRVMIALALACKPTLLIADEPTTGLDVTTQAAIMDLIAELATDQGMATIIITHDLGLAAEYCHRIAVMHAGHVVETASTRALFAAPGHPYTGKLIAATPRLEASLRSLASIPGGMPDLKATSIPACRFSPRCDRYANDCDGPLPRQPRGEDGMVACRHPL